MLSKEFVCGGKAIFTLEVPESFQKQENTRPHYTYKVSEPKFTVPFLFVSVLTGPENTKDYTYLGILFPETGIVKFTEKSQFTNDSPCVRLLRRVTANLWAGTGAKIEAAGFKLHHEGKCGRCGRRLTVPQSIECGIGPECIKGMTYGAPVVTGMDIARNGGIMEDVYGSPDWETENDWYKES